MQTLELQTFPKYPDRYVYTGEGKLSPKCLAHCLIFSAPFTQGTCRYTFYLERQTQHNKTKNHVFVCSVQTTPSPPSAPVCPFNPAEGVGSRDSRARLGTILSIFFSFGSVCQISASSGYCFVAKAPISDPFVSWRAPLGERVSLASCVSLAEPKDKGPFYTYKAQ